MLLLVLRYVPGLFFCTSNKEYYAAVRPVRLVDCSAAFIHDVQQHSFMTFDTYGSSLTTLMCNNSAAAVYPVYHYCCSVVDQL